MITAIEGFKMETISDTLLLLKRAPKKLGESDAANWASKSVEPITHFIAEMLELERLWIRLAHQKYENDCIR